MRSLAKLLVIIGFLCVGSVWGDTFSRTYSSSGATYYTPAAGTHTCTLTDIGFAYKVDWYTGTYPNSVHRESDTDSYWPYGSASFSKTFSVGESTTVSAVIYDSSGAEKKELNWVITIPQPAVLYRTPSSLSFGETTTTKSFSIKNNGGSTLSYSISDNESWLSVSPTSGTASSETNSITVSVNRSGISPGTYSGTITINPDVGANQTVAISMTVPDGEPNASRNTPSSSAITLNYGASYTFKADGYDSGGDLAYADWTLSGAASDTDHDSFVDTTSKQSSYSRTFNTSGNYTLRCRFSDDDGDYDDATWSIYVKLEEPDKAASPSPDHQGTGVGPGADLDWVNASRATSYKIYFGTSSSPSLADTVSSSSWDPPGYMDYNTRYYWRVDTVNEGGTTTGDLWYFNTDPGSPVKVTTPTPADNSSNCPITQDLSWTGGGGATVGYKVYLGTSSTSLVLQDDITGTAFALPTLSYGTDYYWRVDAHNGAGTTAPGDVWHFKIIIEKPVKASNPLPAHQITGVGPAVDLDWDDASRASSYKVYFGTSSNPFLADTVSSSEWDPGIMEDNTRYYWRVDTVNAGGATTGDLWYFDTDPGTPVKPSNPTPADDATDQPITQDLSWSNGGGATEDFRIYFGTSAGSMPLQDEDFVGTSFALPGLQYNTDYYWRVDAHNGSGTYATGDTWHFKTESLPDAPTGVRMTEDTDTAPSGAPASYNSDGVTKNDRPEFSWDAVSGATAYHWEIRRSSDQYLIASSDESSTTGDPSVDLPDGKYTFAVMALFDADNTTYCPDYSFSIDTESPVAPSIQSPTNYDRFFSEHPLLTWDQIEDGCIYKVAIWRKSDLFRKDTKYTQELGLNPSDFITVEQSDDNCWIWVLSVFDAAGNESEAVESRYFIDHATVTPFLKELEWVDGYTYSTSGYLSDTGDLLISEDGRGIGFEVKCLGVPRVGNTINIQMSLSLGSSFDIYFKNRTLIGQEIAEHWHLIPDYFLGQGCSSFEFLASDGLSFLENDTFAGFPIINTDIDGVTLAEEHCEIAVDAISTVGSVVSLFGGFTAAELIRDGIKDWLFSQARQAAYNANEEYLLSEIPYLTELSSTNGYRGFKYTLGGDEFGYSRVSSIVVTMPLSVTKSGEQVIEIFPASLFNAKDVENRGTAVFPFIKQVRLTLNVPRDFPDTASALSPDDGIAIPTLSPTLEWSSFEGDSDGDTQAGFEVRIRDAEDHIVHSNYVASTTLHSYQIPEGALVFGEHYHWHVRYKDSGGQWSAWSADTPETHQDFYTVEPGTFTIYSDHGAPNPVSGSYTYTPGEQMAGGSVVSPADEAGGVRYRCFGFSGTGDAPSGSELSYSAFTINQDSTLTWEWIAQYEATASAGANGSIAPAGSTWADAGADVVYTATPDFGYQVDHWEVNGIEAQQGELSFALGDLSDPSAVAVYFSVIPVNQYTITFDSAGGTTVGSVTQESGTAIVAPADPTRIGYLFAGWNPEIPSTMPSTNLTFTAQWTINQYTLTFDSAGGSAIDPITQDYGTAVTPPANPTRTGYTFTGWNPAVPATMSATNLTLMAQWEIVPATTYALTVENGSGDGSYTNDSIVSIEADAAPSGQAFEYWSVVPAAYAGNIADTNAASTMFTMPVTNVTITALYESIVSNEYTYIDISTNSWNKWDQGAWADTAEGLQFFGTGYRRGTTITSEQLFDFEGADLFIKWKPNGNNAYMGIGLGISGSIVYAGNLTTDHVFGSTLVSHGQWYYTRISVASDRSYTAVTCSGGYDVDGGSVLLSYSNTVSEELWPYVKQGAVSISIRDNYGSTGANLVVGEVYTSAEEVPVSPVYEMVADFDESLSLPDGFVADNGWDVEEVEAGNNALRFTGDDTRSVSISVTNAAAVRFKSSADIENYYDNFSFYINGRSLVYWKNETRAWNEYHSIIPTNGTVTLEWRFNENPYSGNQTENEVLLDEIEISYLDTALPYYALDVIDGSGSGSYTNGQQVSLVGDVSPEGYVFSHWSVVPAAYAGNIADTNAASTMFTIPATNVTLTAHYEQIELSIVTSAGVGGSVSPEGTNTVLYGVNLTATITPDTHYHVSDVLVDGSSVGAVTNYVFMNATNSHSLSTSFALDTYQVTFDLGEHGTWTGGGSLTQHVEHGQAATIPWVRSEHGWILNRWDSDFSSVTNEMVVTAQYDELTVFEESFDSLDNWTLWGSPVPVLDTSSGYPAPSFNNHGDGMYDSGAISKQTFDFSKGLTVEADAYQDRFGVWQSFVIGLARKSSYGSSVGASMSVGIRSAHDRGDTTQCYVSYSATETEVFELYDPSTDWRHYRFVIRPDRRVEFYKGSEHLYTSTNQLDMAYNNMPLVLGSRAYYSPVLIDNIRVITGQNIDDTDSNLNQIPDYWEKRYFGGINLSSPSEDADKDGRNNMQEYVFGTDPTDKSDASVLSVHMQGGNMTVDVRSCEKRWYTIEGTDDLLNPNWIVLGRFFGNGADMSLLDPDASNLPCQYYRIKAEVMESDPAIADSDGDGILDVDDPEPFGKDSDHDGMPDAWENDMSLSPSVSNVGMDSDNDGYSDYAEYVFGTHPDDSGSRFFWSATKSGQDDQWSFEVATASNRIYWVDYRSSLTAPWSVEKRFGGNGETNSFTMTPPNGETGYFRIRATNGNVLREGE